MVVVVRELKDKCKDAARMRREKERAEFVKLSKLLPLPSSTTSQLDKASIIRLTSSYLRMRSAFPEGLGENWGTARSRRAITSAEENNSAPAQAMNHNQQQQQSPNIRELGSLILQTLGGFVFALHRDGKIMYISETASVLLGLPQIDLTGSSIFEYVHPADHQDIQAILNLNDSTDLDDDDDDAMELMNRKNPRNELELRRSFCMRMKCILPKRNAGLVSKGYKAIHCSGYLKVRRTLNQTQATETQQQQQHFKWSSYALVAVGHSLLPTASTELRLGKSCFMFRANLDLKLYYVESTMLSLLGYSHNELVGQSLYQFVHVADLQQVEQAHRQILAKGQTVSRYFRLMRPDGAHIWLQAQGTLIDNPRSMPKPQHIVGICSLIANDLSDCRSSILITEPPQSRLHSPVRKISSSSPSAAAAAAAAAPVATQLATNNKRIKAGIPEAQNKTETLEQNRNNKRARKSSNASKNNSGYCHTIGSTRRTSDDTCSVVSSIASTSAYSTSTSSSASSSSSSESSFSHLKSALNSRPQCYNQIMITTEFNHQGHCQQSDYPTTVPSQECWLVSSNEQYNQQDDCNKSTGNTEYQQHSNQACWTQSTTLSPSSVASSSCPQTLVNNPASTTVTAAAAAATYPDQIYLNNQYYHRLEEYPIESGYYYDNCMTAYHSDVPIYVESKEHQTRINTPYDGTADNSYQYQYHHHHHHHCQLQQATTCMSNVGIVGSGGGGGGGDQSNS